MRTKTIFALLLPFVIGACAAGGGNRAIPTAENPSLAAARPMADDTTSLLKLLAKQLVIGSTVDPTNGDKRPMGITIASQKYGKLAKGTLLACNYDNKHGTAAAGTTIVAFPSPAPGAKAVRYAASTSLLGCASLTIDSGGTTWASAAGAKSETAISTTKKVTHTIKSPFVRPWNNMFGTTGGLYPTTAVFASDASNGSIVRIDPVYFTATAVITGFAVKSGNLAPTGLQYDASIDTLYIADGANNTVVAVAHAMNLFKKGSIVVKSGGTTFGGPDASWARLVFSGAPLNGAIGSTLLPNHNLVFANTLDGAGKNLLVEMTPHGKVLATRNVDKGAAGALGGLYSTGTTDAGTQIYFTDGNANNVQVLKQ